MAATPSVATPPCTRTRTDPKAASARCRRPGLLASASKLRPATSRSRGRCGSTSRPSLRSSSKLWATRSSSLHMPSTVLSTRTKSPQRKLQEGQAIVLIALLILVLFGMLGLAVDSGRSYVDRRDQQAAVDAAALAAGDWYDNYSDLYGNTLPNSKLIYADNLHLYGAIPSPTHTYTL